MADSDQGIRFEHYHSPGRSCPAAGCRWTGEVSNPAVMRALAIEDKILAALAEGDDDA